MKLKLFLASIALLCFCSSCENDRKVNYHEALLGEWIVYECVGKDLSHIDTHFYLNYTDTYQTYGGGYAYADSKEWKESKDYTYSLDGDKLTVIGNNADAVATELKVKLLDMNDKQASYEVISLKYDGEEVSEERGLVYKMRKVDADVLIVGTWLGSDGDNLRRWEIRADGSYVYSYQENGEWIVKSDNDGKYFLYGDFLVCNFNNDIDGEDAGRMYECWNISRENGTLTWKGNNMGNEVTIEMECLYME